MVRLLGRSMVVQVGWALLLCGAILAAVSAAAAETVIKLGTTSAYDQPETLAAKEFAKMVAERTKGQMRVDVLAAGSAGGEREIAEGLQIGTMHMAILAGILQNFDPAMMVLEWDLLFKNDEHVKAAMYGPIGERIKKRLLDKTQIRMNSIFMRTPRLLTTNKPVTTLDDLKGMKIRVPEMPARVALWRALGARPTPMAAPEILTGLTLGTIDGQENPAALIYTRKFYEAVKNLALTNHLYGFMLLVSSDRFYGQLPMETQKIIQQAAIEAGQWNDAYVKKTEADDLAKLSKAMKVTHPDIAPWRAATKDVYKQFSGTEGFMELYQAIVDEGKKF
jgi:tripartite ATP-independent transporter DctP family solute receptor